MEKEAQAPSVADRRPAAGHAMWHDRALAPALEPSRPEVGNPAAEGMQASCIDTGLIQMKRLLLLAVLSVIAPATTAGPSAKATAAASAPVISGIRAHLFHNKTAKLSDDILGSTRRELWNTIAGANSATATLVVVEVAGPPGATYTGYFGPHTKYTVRLVATERARNKRLLDRSQTIPVLNDEGKVYIGFMLHHGGCTPVRLTATIIGPRSGQPVERSLDFACGE